MQSQKSLALFAGLYLSLTVGAAVAQTTYAPERHVIIVGGQASTQVAPDRATVSAGVTSNGNTPTDAMDANSIAMKQVFAALKQLGIPDRAVRTSGYRLNARYTPFSPTTTPTLIGFTVSNTISILLDDPSKAGTTLETLVRAGANQSAGFGFSVRDSKPFMTQLRAAAIEDARGRAAEIASAARITLGDIVAVQEDAPAGSFVAVTGTSIAANPPPPPPPVAVGEQTLSTTLTVTFAVK